MTSQSGTPGGKKIKIPWYAYFIGSVIYTALGGWLLEESSLLAVICIISAPVGFFYAWKTWKQDSGNAS
jgi:hypothetical protein